MKIYWRRIRISDGADPKTIEDAVKSASAHDKGSLPALYFTEANPDWVLLYDHARKGQIHPKVMRYMKRVDLYYLVGLSFPHPALAQPKTEKEQKYPYLSYAEVRWEQLTKLQGNAIRAKAEIERRNFFWASTFVIVAALVGAAIGGLFGGVL